MPNPRLVKLSSIILLNALIAVFSHTSAAQDISNEQRNAYEARKAYNQKKSGYQGLTTRILQQEERVKQEQARLDKLRAEEQSSRANLDQAKIDLDAKVDALNNVWELRDR